MVKEVCGDLLRQPVDIVAYHASYTGSMDEGLSKQIKTQLLTSDEYGKYLKTCKERGSDLLGHTQLLEAPDGRLIASCFGDVKMSKDGKSADYEALMHSVAKVRNYAKMSGMSVGMPGLIGCTGRKGEWYIVRDMLYKLFNGKDDPELTICYKDQNEFRKWNPGK